MQGMEENNIERGGAGEIEFNIKSNLNKKCQFGKPFCTLLDKIVIHST